MAKKSPERFLHERDQGLRESGPVQREVNSARVHGERVPNTPEAGIALYIGSLAAKHSFFREIPENQPVLAQQLRERQRRQIEAHVIKSEDIPESFWETQQRAAREQGRGDVEIDDETRRLAIEVVQTDQRESLRDWVDYLTSGDAQYPTWFKYYVLKGVTGLTDYDKDKDEFSRRSRRTTNPFPALNREALAYVYDTLEASLNGVHPNNSEVAKIVEGGNFAKIYALSLGEVGFTNPELLKETRGSWAVYHQSDNPKDAAHLSNSLKGYGTGWCTAGEGYAKTQLAAGDFYVYYTLDEDNVARVPRIAVRMEDDMVAEVRGIVGRTANARPAENTRQELEPEMIDIAMEKVKTLQGGEIYLKKAEDMKRLTSLERRVTADPETAFSQSDIRFLYELDSAIQGFGYGKDPRIRELQAKRGERDHAELAHLLPEALIQQARIAYDAYKEIAIKLGVGEIMTEASFAGLLERKEAEWQRTGVMEYLLRELIEKGSRPYLVATPNVLADWRQIKMLAHGMREGEQDKNVHVQDNFLKRYNAEELSGRRVGGLVRLSVITDSSESREHLPFKNANERLARLRDDQPELNFRVPSVLETLSLFYGVRDWEATDNLGVDHFDLPVRRRPGIDLSRATPTSYADPFSVNISSDDVRQKASITLAVG